MLVDGQGMTDHSNPDPVKVKEEHLEDIFCVRTKDVDILEIIDVDDFPSEDERNLDDVVQTEEVLCSSDSDDDVVIRWRRRSSPAKGVRRVESDISDATISSAPKDKSLSQLLDTDMEETNAVERVNEGLISEARKCRCSPKQLKTVSDDISCVTQANIKESDEEADWDPEGTPGPSVDDHGDNDISTKLAEMDEGERLRVRMYFSIWTILTFL